MLLLLLGWVLYYTLHSLLATDAAKQAAAARWPAAARFYRLAYNQLSVWGFLLLYGYQLRLPAAPLWPSSSAGTVAAYLLLVGGGLLAVLALRGYDLAEFAGWAYVRRGSAAADTDLRTRGLNGVVRHPLYTGLLLGLFGFLLLAPTLPRLIFAGCAVAYILVGTRLEERKLLARFGATYARYRRQVPMLLPRLVAQPPRPAGPGAAE